MGVGRRRWAVGGGRWAVGGGGMAEIKNVLFVDQWCVLLQIMFDFLF